MRINSVAKCLSQTCTQAIMFFLLADSQMTMEELSSESAKRNVIRMTDDVNKSSRIAFPPRVDPPQSSRDSLSNKYKEDGASDHLEDSTVSARAADIKEAAAPPKINNKLTPPDDTEVVRHILHSLHLVQNKFFYMTTPEQRAFVRATTCSPQGVNLRSAYTHPTGTLIATMLMSFVIGFAFAEQTSSTSNSSPFRGVTTACKRTVDRMVRFV